MDRIQQIRNHEHYWALPKVNEFWNVVDRIAFIARAEETTDEDEAYLDKVERELERLNPGKRIMVVEGEAEVVDTLYLGVASNNSPE